MATDRPLRRTGILGTIQPLLKTAIDIAHSILLIATAGSVFPNTQAPSQGDRTFPYGKLWKIVGAMQTIEGFSPSYLPKPSHSIRDQVVDGTAGIGLTKWNPTIHTPGGLPFDLVGG